MNKTTYAAYAIVALLGVAGAVLFTAALRGPETPEIVGNISTVKENQQNQNLPGQVILLGNTQNIHWNPSDFPTEFVKIVVIKRVSAYPATYELVRTVAESTANDGTATWVPTNIDMGQNIFVEIGCTNSTESCTPSISMTSLAVNFSPSNQDIAAAYQAIEQAANYK